MHEAQCHRANSFLTLTYDNENLPATGSLNKKHFQDFMKRLRKRIGRPLRFFHCGEYGDKFARPHYHCCLFGWDFPDRVFYREANSIRLYTSPLLTDVWGFGYCVLGDLTFESAAYTARYCMKKITGPPAQDHYLCVDRETGEILQDEDGSLRRRLPEYVTMSRRPGIATKWYEKYGDDVFPDDEVIVRGKSSKPPRFYDNLLEREDIALYEKIKRKRFSDGAKRAEDNTPARLFERELCVKSRVKRLKRGVDSEI